MIYSSIEVNALRDGGHIALVGTSGSLTYGDLAREIGRTVGRLKALGFDSSRPIAMLCENRIEQMLVYYAVAKMGGRFLPVNASLSVAEVAYIIEHADAAVLIYDDRMSEIALPALAMNGSAPGLKLDELMRTTPPTDGDVVDTQDEESTFLMVYTSGSTGRPKGVALNQAAEVAGNASLIEMWGMTADDVNIVALPLGYHYGLSTATGATLQSGGRAVILRRFHPREVLEAMQEHKATVFQGVPTMFAMMLEYAEQNNVDVDLSFMRVLVSAGAPLSSDLRRRFEVKFGKEIEDYYALTETRPVFGRYANDPAQVPSGAIGKLAPNVVIKIVDAEGREVQDGVTGEILVRGPSTTLGYVKSEELTRELFLDGLIKTGDLGYRDANGFYYLTGRSKDLIIRGGANIAPAEVEQVIGAHEDIGSVAVIGVPDEKFGQLVAAYVVPRTGHLPDEDSLKLFCQGKLAEFKIPAFFVAADVLPLGVTGKVDKKVLLAQWMEKHQ